MSIAIPTTEPAVITAGDTIQWQISNADYPADSGWTLKYALVSSLGVIAITSAAAGSDHLVTISATTSGTYKAGDYRFQKYVEKGSTLEVERITLDSGTISIVAALSALTVATDTRSQNRRILDAINLAIEGRASRTDLEYELSTGGSTRKIKSLTVDQLLLARDRYTLAVWREQNPGKLAPQIRLKIGGCRG
ncbi:MAG: hypothetical protein ABFD44_13790 [Anaerolineaceae bacterium]